MRYHFNGNRLLHFTYYRFFIVCLVSNALVFFMPSGLMAQAIEVITNPDKGQGYVVPTNILTPPVLYNNKLYIVYKNAAYRYQLAESDGSTLTLIANPDNGSFNEGVQGSFIVYNNKLYLQYLNAAGIFQLAQFDGTTLKLVANPDASTIGYAGHPILFNNKLCLQYITSIGKGSLAEYDGTAISLVANLTTNDDGYVNLFAQRYPSPFVFNDKLYFQYTVASSGIRLAQYDGVAITLITNPDNGNVTTTLTPVNYNGNIYFHYINQYGVIFLAKFNGAVISLVPNTGNGSIATSNNTPAIVFNNKLYFKYADVSGNNYELAFYDGVAITVIPNPNNGFGYIGQPVVYNNTLCFQYCSQPFITYTYDVAQYDGSVIKLIPPFYGGSGFDGDGSFMPSIVYNNKLYFLYQKGLATNYLAQYDDPALTLVPNTSDGSYAGNPIEFNGKLYFQYYSGGANHLAYLCTIATAPGVSIKADTTGNICFGTPVTFTATPNNGGTAPAFQWKLNGINAGTNNTIYTNASLTATDTVTCTITSSVSCSGPPVTSNSIALKIYAAAIFSVSIVPSANNICSGSAVTFTAMPVNGVLHQFISGC